MSEQYHRTKTGEFKVVLMAKKIQRDAFRIISTEKYVSKRMRWLGADEIAKVAKAFKKAVYNANNTNLENQMMWDERLVYQERAIAILKTLSMLMDDLADDIGFSREHTQQFQKDINEELALLHAWQTSDRKKMEKKGDR